VVEWHLRGDNGKTDVRRDEPHASLWLDFSLWLQSWLVTEDAL
jgi:putative cardiolipin synthase